MTKLKEIKLKNFCGYKDFYLSFVNPDNSIRKWTVFYGPNGVGKSNFLRAVDVLSNPIRLKGKKNHVSLRKVKYHPDFRSGVETLYENMSNLYMEAIFLCGKNERKVVLEDNVQGQLYAGRKLVEGEISGVSIDEFQPGESGSIFLNADHPLNMNIFQIHEELKDPFLDFCRAVYGFECSVCENSRVEDNGLVFFTDFILHKPDGTDVHYRRFSDGEKKIATLIAGMFTKGHKDSPVKTNSEIFLIDNIEMHIYFKRHMNLIKKIEEFFPEKQIIATTHSSIIVSEMDHSCLCDLEERLYGKVCQSN
jgi:energy-coupling factor transporter ATP-binding protein EcfA2